MSEPGKANLWKSWVRWVSTCFTLCIALAILVPVGFGVLVGGPGRSSALGAVAATLVPVATVTLFLLGVFGGIVWSSYIAPPLAAGGLRHLRWKDRPKRCHDRLAFAPMTPAVLAGAVTVLVPLMIVGLSWFVGEDASEGFSFGFFFGWAVPITVVLTLVGYPIRVATQRRCRRTIAEAGVCFKCGYNLHGTIGDACPECGEPIPDLAKRAVSPEAQPQSPSA